MKRIVTVAAVGGLLALALPKAAQAHVEVFFSIGAPGFGLVVATPPLIVPAPVYVALPPYPRRVYLPVPRRQVPYSHHHVHKFKHHRKHCWH